MVKFHQHFVQRVVWSLLASYLQVQIYCRQLWGMLAEVSEMYVVGFRSYLVIVEIRLLIYADIFYSFLYLQENQ